MQSVQSIINGFKIDPVCSHCKVKKQAKDSFLAEIGVFEPCQCEGASKERSEREKAENAFKEEAENREKQDRLKLLLKSSGVPERFEKCNLNNFFPGNNREILAAAIGFVAMFPRSEGLFFAGGPGLGKTHLAYAIAMELIKKGHQVVVGTVPSLLSGIRAGFERGNESAEAVLRRYKTVKLLILDDFGKEKPSEWVEEMVYDIINARYEANRPLIVTSNLKISEVADRYGWNGVAIRSRLFQMCQPCLFEGIDYRLKVAENRGMITHKVKMPMEK